MSQDQNEKRVKLDLNNEVFQEHLLTLEKDDAIRVLKLNSCGKSFIATSLLPADFKEFSKSLNSREVEYLYHGYRLRISDAYQSGKPQYAVVDGKGTSVVLSAGLRSR